MSGAWSRLGELWSEWRDDDPAITRMREALRPRETTPEAAPAPEPALATVKPRPVPLDPAERLARIAALVARLEAEAGDKVAADQLRALLDS